MFSALWFSVIFVSPLWPWLGSSVLRNCWFLKETSNKDLSTLAKAAFELLKWRIFWEPHLQKAVSVILSSANDVNWRTRSATLTYLRTFMYRYAIPVRVYLMHQILFMSEDNDFQHITSCGFCMCNCIWKPHIKYDLFSTQKKKGICIYNINNVKACHKCSFIEAFWETHPSISEALKILKKR